MSTLSEARIAELLAPYLNGPTANVPVPDGAGASRAPVPDLYPKLSAYLDLLVRWNTRTNLTAIRGPEEIVQRHFGESLFAARCLADRLADSASILDFGSGAGFPGLPIQLFLPRVQVVLAESQGKKAAFLREAVRVTQAGAEVWAGRVERMEPGRRFDAATLRAVDDTESMVPIAAARVRANGWLVRFETSRPDETSTVLAIPGLQAGVLAFARIS